MSMKEIYKSSNFHIPQRGPIDPRALKPFPYTREPKAQDPSEKEQQNDGGVVGTVGRDGQLGREADEHGDDGDEDG